MAKKHLKDMDKMGRSGEWKFSVTKNGYVVQETFITILKDYDDFWQGRILNVQ